MNIRITILILVLLFTGVACNKENYQKDFEDVEEPENKSYRIGRGMYEKKKIPFIKIDMAKGEYFRLLQYEDEIRAIKLDNGDPKNYNENNQITNIQLYILENEEWKPSMKWSLDFRGIHEFFQDSNGNLCAHYYDMVEVDAEEDGWKSSQPSSDATKLLKFNLDGSVEIIPLEDGDIMSLNIPYIQDGKDFELTTSVQTPYMTENDELAVTYFIPDENELITPKLILYDAYTGKKISEMDYPTSDVQRYMVHKECLISYAPPITKKHAPTLDTFELKTGKLIRKTFFDEADKWEPMDASKLLILLGKEEDIYVCSPRGLYGGGLNQEQIDLLMTADKLGYGNGNIVDAFCIGKERDFYLLYGYDYENMNLYHFTPND